MSVKAKLNEQKKRKNNIFLLSILVLFLAVVKMYLLAGYFDKSEQTSALPFIQPKKINILVLGINKRRHDAGRSNVTGVLTIDARSKKLSALWIPRDTRVNIPGYGWDKIGHAYAFDGPELSKKTVENFLGITINYYAAIDMAGFAKVIDAVGGVNINVEKRLYYYDPYDRGEAATNHGLIDLQPGMQHMDGNTAMQYVRFRNDPMGDIGRTERQRKFLKAFLDQVTSPKIIRKIPAVIREVNTALETNLSAGDMLRLANIINDAYKSGLQTDMVSGRPGYIGGISYWLPDIAAMRAQVAEIQGITPDETYLAKTQDLVNEYEQSISRRIVRDTAPRPPAPEPTQTVSIQEPEKVEEEIIEEKVINDPPEETPEKNLEEAFPVITIDEKPESETNDDST